MEQTPIQKRIENMVTSGRGYDFDYTYPPFKNSEIGLQSKLGYMNLEDGKLSIPGFFSLAILNTIYYRLFD